MKLMFMIPAILIALFVFCIILIFHNAGSPKIYTTIFIGLSSFIASTFFILQPENISRSFGITVAIDSSNLPASIVNMDMNSVEKRQNRLAGFFVYMQMEDINYKVDQEMLLESLEYSFLEDILMFGRSSEGVALSNRGDGVFEVSTSLRGSPNYQTFQLTDVSQYSKELNKNRFFVLNLMSWDIQKVRLPKGTHIELIREQNIKGFHIWKNNFFGVDIIIKEPSIKAANLNSVPIGFRSEKEYSKNIRAENFTILLRANFSRISSENPETENNKAWIKSLFDLLEKNYSDSNNNEYPSF